MKTTTIITLSLTTILSFIVSYFTHLVVDNVYQFLSIAVVIFADGFFGIWAGIKREGFKTFKALSVVRTFVFWIILLACVLSIERGFPGTGWLSETIIPPFLLFQVLSILKNASKIGVIHAEVLIKLLDRIDNHKDTVKKHLEEIHQQQKQDK